MGLPRRMRTSPKKAGEYPVFYFMKKTKKKMSKKEKKSSKKKKSFLVVKFKKIKKTLKKKIHPVKSALGGFASRKFNRARKIKERNKTERIFSPEKVAFAFFLILSLAFGFSAWQAGREISKIEYKEAPRVNPMEIKIRQMASEHPIKEMAPYIANQNEEVAKYLVAIAKKESNWGKYSPQKNGKTCYNYWGYRGTYNQTESGYSCFDNPRQAVKVVGERIGELLAQGITTPDDMIVWKCGRSCAGHGSSAQKWIDDVGLYYEKL